MSLELVRVDDRLIHGQVVALWLAALRAARVIVVDDETARDPFLREVVELAAPADTVVEVLDLATGTRRAARAAATDERTLVLVRSPGAALELRRAGVKFDVLNLGGMGAAPGRRPLHRSISASAEELDALRELERLGTRVEVQIVPADRPVGLAALAPAAASVRDA